jgi:hypothetical protein
MLDSRHGKELSSERWLEVIVAGKVVEGGSKVRTGGGAANDEAKTWICFMERRGFECGATFRRNPLESVPGVVDASWKGMFGSEAVARSDTDHVVLSDKQAEEWDFRFRISDAVTASVEHEEDREGAARLLRGIGKARLEGDDPRHVAITHGDVVGCLNDIFRTV